MLPRRPLDHRGVSEVIGSILILLITVIIFSSITLWVHTLPAPRAASNVGFDGTLEWRYVAGSGPGAYVNLTHLGGDDLLDTNTRIYLTIGNQTHTFRTRGFDGVIPRPYGVNGPDVHWNIGETWSYENETIDRTARVSVLIVDVVRGTILWDQILLGEGGEHRPIFLDKWFDSEPLSPSRDPVVVRDTFAIYARVGDPDGDLNRQSVWANFTFRPNGTPLQLMYDPSDDVFTLRLPWRAELGWDGGIILLNATDEEGHEARSRMTLSVETFPDIIPSKFWQYVGAVQVNLEDVWFTQMGDPVNTDRRFSPYRTVRSDINGGNLFHIMMSNHGNRTVFLDGWTVMSFGRVDTSVRFSEYIVELVNSSLPGNDGGLGEYPGVSNDETDFQYAHLLDINLGDQEAGGTPQEIIFTSSVPFDLKDPSKFSAAAYYVTMLISGIMGPRHMTWEDIQAWQDIHDPGVEYDPFEHLRDDDPATKTYFYAQVVPFIGLVVYP